MLLITQVGDHVKMRLTSLDISPLFLSSASLAAASCRAPVIAILSLTLGRGGGGRGEAFRASQATALSILM